MKFRLLLPFYIKVSIIYICFSLTYIYLSDVFLMRIANQVDVYSVFQSVKGSLFVLISGGLICQLTKKNNKKIELYYAALTEERKRSFDNLKRSEEKYWTVFNHNPLPMWIYDVDTLKFLLVNEAACKKYGYTTEEFYAMGINDIRPATYRNIILDYVNIAVTTKHKIWRRPFKHLTKSGKELVVHIESAEISFDNKIARLVTATDLTHNIQQENLLVEANRRLQNASDIAGLGYWSKDLITGKIYWSDNMFNIFDENKDTFDIDNKNSADVDLHVEEELVTVATQLPGDTKVKEIERCIRTRQGMEKWLLERVSLVKDANGTPTTVEGIVVDITERKLAERRVEISNDRFKMVAKAAIEAIIDWDIVTGDIFWGDGFKQLFGYENTTEDRTLWIRNIHPEDKYRVLLNLVRAMANTEQMIFIENFRYIKANGEVSFVEHRGVFTRNDHGKAIRAVGAMIDVTHLKSRLATIKRQNEQLREIAWVQSHVVRAPLANLLGLTDMAKSMYEEGKIPMEILNGMGESAQKLDMVIRDIVRKTEEIDKIHDH